MTIKRYLNMTLLSFLKDALVWEEEESSDNGHSTCIIYEPINHTG